MKLNSQQFRRLTGHKPVDDDLDRVNCLRAGGWHHQECGLNTQGMPHFMGKDVKPRKAMPIGLLAFNLRRKRWWKPGWKLKRRAIPQLCTKMDAKMLSLGLLCADAQFYTSVEPNNYGHFYRR